jgi:ABC-type nitrate/sulfonate/bicarbonate transport system substrate-binding protein
MLGMCGTLQARPAKVAIPAQNLTAIAFVVAQEKGYYREEGLEVQLILMSPPISTLALIGGDIDFSTAAGGALNSAVRGAPLRFLFHTYYRGLYWLYTRPDIRDVLGLKGKKIGLSGIGSGPYYLVMELLKRHGLIGGRDVTILVTGAQSSSFAALASGTVDATSLSPPFMFKAQDAGLRELVAFVNEDFVELQSAVVVKDSLLQSDRAFVEKFLRGTVKGFLYSRDNRIGTIPIVSRLLNIKDDVAARTYDLYRSAMTPNGTINRNLQQRYLEDVAGRMQLKESPSIEKIFNYSMAEKIHAELIGSGWKP